MHTKHQAISSVVHIASMMTASHTIDVNSVHQRTIEEIHHETNHIQRHISNHTV
jgi:hypothetical protein